VIGSRELIFLGMIEAVRVAYGDPLDEEELDVRLQPLFAFAEHVRKAHDVPDPMPAGWNRPAPAGKADVVRVLLNAAVRVDAGDSFEGTITWEMPMDEPELDGADFGLIARYRVGNLDGQGGMKVWQPEASE
jgi:hypothetical protein